MKRINILKKNTKNNSETRKVILKKKGSKAKLESLSVSDILVKHHTEVVMPSSNCDNNGYW